MTLNNEVWRYGKWSALVIMGLVLASQSMLMAQQDSNRPDSQDSITIYSSASPGGVPPGLYLPGAGRYSGQVPGFAMVRHIREYDLTRGISTLRVVDVAAGIDPTTVAFRSLSQPETRVLEQSFEFDLVSTDKLLERYIGQQVIVEQVRGDSIDTVSGELLGTAGGLMLRLADGSVQTLSNYQNVRFPSLPDGLITRPTLLWQLDAPQRGRQQVQIAYQTSGMTWWTDYNLIIDPGQQCRMDLSAWVTLVNQSGAAYRQAKLKLIAGEVNRVQDQNVQYRNVRASAVLAEADSGFSEKSFNEYHLYTLGRPMDLPQNATKQVELFPAVNNARCEQLLVIDGSPRWYAGGRQLSQNITGANELDASIVVQFENTEDNGLGIPLPAGRVRVSQLDEADGNLEFVGEDAIGHTPRKDTVVLNTGVAFDVKAARKQTEFRIDSKARQAWETIEVQVRNRKRESTEVVVNENLFRASGWEITSSSDKYSKINSNTIQYRLSIPADTVKTITYEVHYRW